MEDSVNDGVRGVLDRLLTLDEADYSKFLESLGRENPQLLIKVEHELSMVQASVRRERASRPDSGEAMSPSEGIGDRIGPYELQAKLGEGTYGVVWRAERREPFPQVVAIKIVKRGMDRGAVLENFRLERETLGRLNHPHVAQIFDGGVTPGGRAYLVMSCVDGLPINQYCDSWKLSVRERLEVFLQVCDAVEHAHRREVIHRDLKPRNILVTRDSSKRAQAKVIDFGVAKVLSPSLARAGGNPARAVLVDEGPTGTWPYMSPEQADPNSQEVDTRTDVYSLGVLLCELLAGVLPLPTEEFARRSAAERVQYLSTALREPPSVLLKRLADAKPDAARRIAEDRRERLDRLVRQFGRELEWIPAMAMQIDAGQRYQTVQDLASDVRNYLEGRPLAPGSARRSYRLRKFIGRHRAATIGACAVGISLAMGLGGVWWQWREAVARAEELRRVSAFQSSMLENIKPVAVGEDLISEIRRAVVAATGTAEATEAERAARLGAFEKALELVNPTDVARTIVDRAILRPAVDAIETDFGNQPLVAAELRQSLANLYLSLAMYPEAKRVQAAVLSARRALLGSNHPDTLRSLHQSGFIHHNLGENEQAAAPLVEALEGRRRALGPDHPETIQSQRLLGMVRFQLGNAEEAVSLLHDAHDRLLRIAEAPPQDLIESGLTVGALYMQLQQSAQAEPYLVKAYEDSLRVLGEDSEWSLQAAALVGSLYFAQDRLDDAITLQRSTLERRRSLFGEEHDLTAAAINNLATALQASGKLEEAEGLLADAAARIGRIAPDTANHVTIARNWSAILIDMERFAEAAGQLAGLEAAARTCFAGDQQPLLADFLWHLGTARASMAFDPQRFEDAEKNLTEALGLSKASDPELAAKCATVLKALYTRWDQEVPNSGFGEKSKAIRLETAKNKASG